MLSGSSHSASPYKGLLPYSEKDAPFFFGREEETVIISANLFASPLTLLYGASGVGKSSVLHAGVAHQLRVRDDLLVVVFSSWQVDPTVALKTAVVKTVEATNSSSLSSYHALSLADFLVECAKQTNRRLLIILDQFEEYFLYHPKEDAFAVEFPLTVMQSDAPISFLLSLREDSLAKLDRFEGRIPFLFDNYLRIEHLDYEAARDAIEKPIEQYNRLIAPVEGQVSIRPDLVDAVLQQVETGRVLIGAAGRGVIKAENIQGHIETPYLQLVMTRLWDEEMRKGSLELRLETLDGFGGANNIVRTHLDATMSSLPDHERNIAANIFHYLVTPSGTTIAHTITDLSEYANIPQEQLVPVLEKLARGEQRILRAIAPLLVAPEIPRYEIYHDVLASAILDWRARYIQEKVRLEAERKAEEQQRHAEEQARAREQAKVAVRLRRLAAALVSMVLLTGAAAVFATTQLKLARMNEKKALLAQHTAELQRVRANTQSQLAIQQTELARANEEKAIAAGKIADIERQRALKQAQLAESERARAENQGKLLATSLAEVKKAREKEAVARQLAEVVMQREAEKARQLSATLVELKKEKVQSDAYLRTDQLNRDALSLYQRGNYQEAMAGYSAALQIYHELGHRMGEADTLSNMGNILQQQGKLGEALQTYSRAISISPGKADLYKNRGSVYRDMGQYDKALNDLNQALAIQKQRLGPTHLEVASTLNNIGLLYANLGEYSEAIENYQRALRITEIAAGSATADVANALHNLAVTYLEQNDNKLAEPLLLRALTIREKTLGAEHPQVAVSLNNLGLLYSSQKDYERAESVVQRALVITEKTLGVDHPNVANTLEILGAIYAQQSKFMDAEPLFKRALVIQTKVFGPDSANVAQSLKALAGLYSNQAKYAEALSLYQRALFIERSVKSIFDEADTLTKLAVLYIAQSDYARAEPLLEQALSGFERTTGSDSQRVVEVLELYVKMLRKTGRNTEADRLEARIKTIRSKNPQ
jgi:tetratricopeptide (TPR) repeat protein